MSHMPVCISVRGLSEAEGSAGVPHLREEFQHRPWLRQPRADWDSARNELAITLDYPGDDSKRCAEAALDEIRDCVVACFQFSSDIQFELEHSTSTTLRGTPNA